MITWTGFLIISFWTTVNHSCVKASVELFDKDYSDFDKNLFEVSEEEILKIDSKLLERLENGVPMNVIQRPLTSKLSQLLVRQETNKMFIL